MRARILSMILALVLVGSIAGCGSSRDKGKNQDFDRPKSTGRN